MKVQFLCYPDAASNPVVANKWMLTGERSNWLRHREAYLTCMIIFFNNIFVEIMPTELVRYMNA